MSERYLGPATAATYRANGLDPDEVEANIRAYYAERRGREWAERIDRAVDATPVDTTGLDPEDVQLAREYLHR